MSKPETPKVSKANLLKGNPSRSSSRALPEEQDSSTDASMAAVTATQPRSSSVIQSHSKVALQEAYAIRELAASTNEELDAQGERLVKVSRTTAQVHDDLNVTDRLVSGIESFWSAFANKFRFDNSKDNRKAQAKKEDEIDEEMNQDENTIAVARHEHERAEMKAKMRQMTERNAQVKYGVEEIDEYFEETDRDLDELSDVLADIKGASLKMRAGLVRDNKVLDRLEPEAARAEERLRKTNAKIDRLK